jgi:quinol monooxygenase YgiN
MKSSGYHNSLFYQSIENPRQFCLIVWWDSIEAHMKTFREGPLFGVWRERLTPYMDTDAIKPGITFSHYDEIAGTIVVQE